MKYLGKFGIIIPIGVLLMVGITSILLFESLFILAIITMIYLIFLILCCFPTYLILENDCVEVRVGFHKKIIFCKDIISLQKIHASTQDYALALDRVKINLSNNDSTMVSLRKNNEFIIEIIEQNPHIQLIKK